MNSTSSLSVIIITRNEEADIVGCLESVKGLADEIILVDSGSTDRTVELVKRYTTKVYFREWDGFSTQKQYALDKAAGPWVLNIDADERVAPELAKEIKEVLAQSSDGAKVHGFEIPFKNIFLGKELRFGAGACETHVRLFLKGKASYGQEQVHEGIQVEGMIGKLHHPIEHFSYKDLNEYLTKCNFYTSIIAKKKFEQGHRFCFWHHLRLPYEFFVRYVLKLGFLDGGVGFTYAVLSSYYVWLKFLKLRDLATEKSEVPSS